ncbi:MAG: ABC transporter permease [Prevotellaceae bacterium]|jgi:ABC-2 type transport system permease protein|nr:ABC transporter permease [Prevotellaceae bacterium]
MNQFTAFIYKEFYHIMRDLRTMLILLVMPIIQIILFGFAISTEVKEVRFAVYDPSKDISTHSIINRLSANKYFTLTEILPSVTGIEKLFKENKADLVLVFENRFNENLYHNGKASLQLIVDGTDSNTATIITGYANNIIASYQYELLKDNEIPYQIIPETKLLYNPQMKSAYNFVPGVMGLILMLICAMMTSISIVREKEQGTMELLLASPMKPLLIIFSKAIPYLVLSVINLATILLLSVYLLKVPILGSFLWLVIISLIFILVALSLGLLISSLVRTQIAAMLASGLILMMPVVVLSGMIFPIENMPLLLQGISAVLPARWYISAIRKVMIEGLDVAYVVEEIGVLLAMVFVLMIINLKKFKYRLE